MPLSRGTMAAVGLVLEDPDRQLERLTLIGGSDRLAVLGPRAGHRERTALSSCGFEVFQHDADTIHVWMTAILFVPIITCEHF